jgi:hypothetical protein
MSWLFSRALVEEFSLANCSETEPSAQLNVMPTQQLFWHNDKMMDCSRFSRFGVTCALLTEVRGAELLTAFLAGFHVKTSALPEVVPDLKASDPASGASLRASFARWSPESFGWKTVQCSLLEDSRESLRTLPRWGLMRNGMLYLRQTLAPGISVTGYGSLLPTLTVCGNYNAKGSSATSGDGLHTVLKLLPTLVADDTGSRKTKYAQGGTPLSLAVKLLPTHERRDFRHPGRSRLERTGGTHGECLPQEIGGPLNPDWCEWFMGWPVGWTALSALAMDKFQEWQQQHSPRSPQSLATSPEGAG